uniref:NADH-ubiquinone oxidoreductase chain 4 n=1 Tax=Megaris sp. TaxID=2931300 RepID=A0A8T9ZW02_9HEMI|nr:NADH dehydrogenase subunit 4 [Megaris sp.]
MMKYLMFIFFLIPVLEFWYLILLFLGILMILFINTEFFFNFMSVISGTLGGDVISYYLIFLSMWIIFLIILASTQIYNLKDYNHEFMLTLIFLLIFLSMTFICSNFLYFYMFFEGTLIPTLFIIFGWGGQPERLASGWYFLFYTLFASLPLLGGIMYLYNFMNTVNFYLIILSPSFMFLLCMILAFLVKLPMVFFHFWLPKAHVEAPISGSMILAGVLLKMGGYGLYRVYLFIDMYMYITKFFMFLCLWGSIIMGLVCMFQVDMKSMIAYSSVSHMGLSVMGFMTMGSLGFVGSFIIMLGHGFCSSGLFCLFNFIYLRTHTRSQFINKGLLNLFPIFSLMWFMLCINNMGSPVSLNMMGEVFIIINLVSWCYLLFMFMLLMYIFISCFYSIYLYSVLCHGSMNYVLKVPSIHICEYLLGMMHWIPLNFLFLKLEFFYY